MWPTFIYLAYSKNVCSWNTLVARIYDRVYCLLLCDLCRLLSLILPLDSSNLYKTLFVELSDWWQCLRWIATALDIHVLHVYVCRFVTPIHLREHGLFAASITCWTHRVRPSDMRQLVLWLPCPVHQLPLRFDVYCTSLYSGCVIELWILWNEL